MVVLKISWCGIGPAGIVLNRSKLADGLIFMPADTGQCRVISDCHFPVQLNHFIPGFLSYSVAVFLKCQSDITLGQWSGSCNLTNQGMRCPGHNGSEACEAESWRCRWRDGACVSASGNCCVTSGGAAGCQVRKTPG
jgi:hypothetical protein